ncbi:MAG: hypothetical protein JO285_13445 [Kutzneria sp.]|nr:hypothetical protein [Kutzneria sp.]
MSPSIVMWPLSVYLNDYLTGAVAGVALARRMAATHRRIGRPVMGPVHSVRERIGPDRPAVLSRGGSAEARCGGANRNGAQAVIA